MALLDDLIASPPTETETAANPLRVVATPDVPAPATTSRRPDPTPTRDVGLLDLDPLLVRCMRNGIAGGVLVALLAIALPLTLARGAAYGLGVGGQVAFWCGIGFGMIAGSAAYTARTQD